MSFAALAWAAKHQTGRAADKLILLAYADRHNEETGCAYPSLAWLCEFSSLNRKTVIEAVGRLESVGILEDTGARQGATKQVKVYRVNIGTVPKTEQYGKRNRSENGEKQTQKRDSEPVRNLASTKASPSTKQRAMSVDPFPMPDGVERQHWLDFLQNRKRKRLPNTPTAHARLLADLSKFSDDEWPPGRILQHAAERGWAGIYDPREREAGNGHGRWTGGNLRGSRPDPALDMYFDACADLASGAVTGDPETDRRGRVTLPAYGPG